MHTYMRIRNAKTGSLRMVDARSPSLYLLMACTVVGAGLLAAWIPARRLSRIDPARTLREEG
jgi:ABC-type lipoprotein release transport system permease subunit